MQIEEGVPLAPLTTFGIGGSARFFARVGSVEELREALDFARSKALKVYILGGGSNVLVPDDGFDGLVIKIEIAGIAVEKKEEGERVVLVAGAGEVWDGVVARAVAEDLWGIENLSGIPGSVGGVVWGSVGAYGASVSQTALWVEAFDRERGIVDRFDTAACVFGYRDSFFKQHAERYVIVRAAFALSRTPQPVLSYKDLAERFAGAIGQAAPIAISDIREAILAIRREKFPNLVDEGTAGSFFKNPILSSAAAQSLRDTYPTMPTFALPEAVGVKVPLAWLLDHVLHLHGESRGGARLFEKQPLVIVASRDARSADVSTLASLVVTQVYETFGIEIEKEVQEMK